MELNHLMWIIWAVLGVALIVAEVFTPGFVLLWFGFGALAASLASLAGLESLTAQFLIFLTLSVALTAASRTIFVNYFVRDQEDGGLKTGAAALPGQVGVVTGASFGALHEGAVKVFGSTWTAYPVEGELPLRAGDRVLIERVSGATLYVRHTEHELGWRRAARELPGEERRK